MPDATPNAKPDAKSDNPANTGKDSPNAVKGAVPDAVRHSVMVPLSPADAFTRFTANIRNWWPAAYTWSQDALQEFGLEPEVGGFCFEIGPGGFRSDWGTVTEWNPDNGRLVFRWQIGPHREPVPNPARSSRVTITFQRQSSDTTVITLVHDEFEQHGDGATEYRDAMASPQGWPFILQQFVDYSNT